MKNETLNLNVPPRLEEKGLGGEAPSTHTNLMFSRIIDFIAPRQCVICGQRLTLSEKGLCGVCNMQLPRTDHALSPTDNEIVRLLWGQTQVERGAALFYYNPATDVARLIHAAKYNDRLDICETLGELLAKEIITTGFFDGIDVLIPVPLTRWRQWKRGYNQSELIARGIGNITHLPVETKALKRYAFSGSQTELNRQQRRENVDGVFQLKSPKCITGRHILLVDDILTTGSTISACSRELLKATDVQISFLTLGYTKG